jgi:hypothetical protein
MYHDEKKIYVKDHPRAFITDKKEPTLWTLITDKREIPVMGSNGILRFLDWDEIPESADDAWDSVVNSMINAPGCKSMPPRSAPCIDPDARVRTHQSVLVPLSDMRIGTWIHDEVGWTKIVGICERTVKNTILLDGTHLTDGNWVLDQKTREWRHPTGLQVSNELTGFQLITESGSFKIYLATGKELVVRDFTEVGLNQIHESDVRVDTQVNA